MPYFFFPFLLHHHKMISVFHSIGIKSLLLPAISFTHCFTIGPPFSFLPFLHTLQHYLDFPFLSTHSLLSFSLGYKSNHLFFFFCSLPLKNIHMFMTSTVSSMKMVPNHPSDFDLCSNHLV